MRKNFDIFYVYVFHEISRAGPLRLMDVKSSLVVSPSPGILLGKSLLKLAKLSTVVVKNPLQIFKMLKNM